MIDLVDRAAAGDRDAFAQLAIQIQPRLHHIAWLMLRNAALADEATQEALLNIWRLLPTLRDHAKFRPWADKAVARASINLARREKRHLHVGLDPGTPTEDSTRGLAQRDELATALAALSPEQRVVVVLHIYLGIEHAEIGATLGIPVGTARSRLHNGLRTLRGILDANKRRDATQ